MEVQNIRDEDWPQVWPILREVAQARDTIAYDPDLSEVLARAMWVQSAPAQTVVAIEDGKVSGSAIMGPNRPGAGSHIATATFVVAADARGKGVGSTLVNYMIDWAREQNYAGIQFNAVVETNTVAVDLYKKLGFVILGTVPGAFEHVELGRVGLHVMFKPLDG